MTHQCLSSGPPGVKIKWLLIFKAFVVFIREAEWFSGSKSEHVVLAQQHLPCLSVNISYLSRETHVLHSVVGASQCAGLINTEIIKKMMLLLSYSYGCNASCCTFWHFAISFIQQILNRLISTLQFNTNTSARVDFKPPSYLPLLVPFRPQVSCFSS